MNLAWQAFLIDQGAQFSESGAVDTFGHPEIERFLVKNGPVISSQAHQALLEVSGEEAFDFLQGQLSNDLNDVNNETGQLTSYCDPQGNVLTTFLVFKVDNRYFLSFDHSLKDIITKRLTMFVMRSKVKITDVSNELIHIGFAGEFADLDVQRLLGTKLKQEYQVGQLSSDEAQATLIKVPGPYHRYEIFASVDSMKVIWQKLKNNADMTNNADWQLLDIVFGIPTLNTETTGQFVAQFLNLDKLQGINFKKGCFPGQEIIARIHYRGKVTKRMVRIHLSEALELSSGEEIRLSDDNNKNYKFTVIAANPDVLQGTLCLAVTTLKPLDSVTGTLKTETGQTASIEPVGYDLSEA